jgi:hypothetical protein
MAHQHFLSEEKLTLTPQLPYSPDLAPCDFRLFPKLKMGLRGRRFAIVDDIKENAEAGLRAIKKRRFERMFQSLRKPMEQLCVCRRTVL